MPARPVRIAAPRRGSSRALAQREVELRSTSRSSNGPAFVYLDSRIARYVLHRLAELHEGRAARRLQADRRAPRLRAMDRSASPIERQADRRRSRSRSSRSRRRHASPSRSRARASRSTASPVASPSPPAITSSSSRSPAIGTVRRTLAAHEGKPSRSTIALAARADRRCRRPRATLDGARGRDRGGRRARRPRRARAGRAGRPASTTPRVAIPAERDADYTIDVALEPIGALVRRRGRTGGLHGSSSTEPPIATAPFAAPVEVRPGAHQIEVRRRLPALSRSRRVRDGANRRSPPHEAAAREPSQLLHRRSIDAGRPRARRRIQLARHPRPQHLQRTCRAARCHARRQCPRCAEVRRRALRTRSRCELRDGGDRRGPDDLLDDPRAPR